MSYSQLPQTPSDDQIASKLDDQVQHDMDEPSKQLHDEVCSGLVRAIQSERPILHHLNADTSWLLQVPKPTTFRSKQSALFYNILIDPWFAGSQVDVQRWFSRQTHAIKSSVQTISDVDHLIQNIESLVVEHAKARHSNARQSSAKAHTSSINAVVISHEFTDHCHQDTLLQLDASVPILAADKAATMIRSWAYFDTVFDLPILMPNAPDWRETSTAALPDWLGVSRIVTHKDALHLHSAVIIAFNTSPAAGRDSPVRDAIEHHEHDRLMREEAAEAVIYSPHGFSPRDAAAVNSALPPIATLALLHGLEDVSLGGAQQLNLGAHNGLQIQRALNARYWIGTHDEHKKAEGLVGLMLKRKEITVGMALEQEGLSIESDQDVEDVEAIAHWCNLANGQSRILY